MRWIPLCSFVIAAISLGDAAPAPPRAPEQQFEEGMLLRFHMHENYGVVRGLERLLLRGRLDEARVLARAIGEAPDEPGAAPFAQAAAEVRTRALAVAAAKTTAEAVRAEASLVLACANCHVAAGAVPDAEGAPAVPPDRDTLEARMARHLWAADRLWIGIVADAPAAWTAGLDVLASGAHTWPALPKQRAALARTMQRAAETARRAKPATLAAKAQTYGELLVTCAACHAR